MVAMRLAQQVAFIVELDKLKSVLRQTPVAGGTRPENDAEHSWHIAVMALVLAEHAAKKDIDLFRVLKMLLLHDVVEIDAGDTFCYDIEGNKDKAAREERAAERLFNLLPADQAAGFRALWAEFEAAVTPEAKYASALDRLQPVFQNYHGGGGSWTKHGITLAQVHERCAPAKEGAPAFWRHVLRIVDDAVEEGLIAKTKSEARNPKQTGKRGRRRKIRKEEE